MNTTSGSNSTALSTCDNTRIGTSGAPGCSSSVDPGAAHRRLRLWKIVFTTACPSVWRGMASSSAVEHAPGVRGHLEGIVSRGSGLDDLARELGREALRLVVDREQQDEACAALARRRAQRERGVGDVFDA